jgi:hypothetical protein
MAHVIGTAMDGRGRVLQRLCSPNNDDDDRSDHGKALDERVT